jgi:hypothetical protein
MTLMTADTQTTISTTKTLCIQCHCVHTSDIHGEVQDQLEQDFYAHRELTLVSLCSQSDFQNAHFTATVLREFETELHEGIRCDYCGIRKPESCDCREWPNSKRLH